jgi:hypothetical protein
MDTHQLPHGESGYNTGRLAGARSTMAILCTQQERRHKLAHRDAVNAATTHITQDTHLNIIRKTGSSKNKMQHTVGCEYIHIDANCSQLILECTQGVHRQLGNPFVSARNGQPPLSTKALLSTVREIIHHDVVISGIFADECPDKHPHE